MLWFVVLVILLFGGLVGNCFAGLLFVIFVLFCCDCLLFCCLDVLWVVGAYFVV